MNQTLLLHLKNYLQLVRAGYAAPNLRKIIKLTVGVSLTVIRERLYVNHGSPLQCKVERLSFIFFVVLLFRQRKY